MDSTITLRIDAGDALKAFEALIKNSKAGSVEQSDALDGEAAARVVDSLMTRPSPGRQFFALRMGDAGQPRIITDRERDAWIPYRLLQESCRGDVNSADGRPSRQVAYIAPTLRAARMSIWSDLRRGATNPEDRVMGFGSAVARGDRGMIRLLGFDRADEWMGLPRFDFAIVDALGADDATVERMKVAVARHGVDRLVCITRFDIAPIAIAEAA